MNLGKSRGRNVPYQDVKEVAIVGAIIGTAEDFRNCSADHIIYLEKLCMGGQEG